jgi:hypothetical protein
MDNIITALEKFTKPDKDFIQDKECLICLESLETLDLESEANKIVKLPCKCANSVYHINCIIKLLHSGENKNFCPHCKTKYENPVHFEQQVHVQVQVQVSRNQIIPYIVINTNQQTNNNFQITIFTDIIMFHIFSNSVMNLINIIVTRVCPDFDSYGELQALMILYFCKFIFNYSIFVYSKNNIEKIKDCLVYSYIYHIVLFGFFMYVLTKIKNDNKTTILIVNNLVFGFIDLIYRKITESKIQNRVNVV